MLCQVFIYIWKHRVEPESCNETLAISLRKLGSLSLYLESRLYLGILQAVTTTVASCGNVCLISWSSTLDSCLVFLLLMLYSSARVPNLDVVSSARIFFLDVIPPDHFVRSLVHPAFVFCYRYSLIDCADATHVLGHLQSRLEKKSTWLTATNIHGMWRCTYSPLADSEAVLDVECNACG